MNYLAIKINNDQFKHFNVPNAVYNYVRQLEASILNQNFEGLCDLYPDRFKKSSLCKGK